MPGQVMGILSHKDLGLLAALVIKNLRASAGDIRDTGLIPGSGRSPGRGLGNPLQYSCLEKSRGQRSLVGSCPWGREESDTEQLSRRACAQAPLHRRAPPGARSKGRPRAAGGSWRSLRTSEALGCWETSVSPCEPRQPCEAEIVTPAQCMMK